MPGLNKYLIEMANIRNQDSWVHSNDPDAATEKAKDLGAHGRGQIVSCRSTERDRPAGNPPPHWWWAAGWPAMTAALSLARQGYPVHLVENPERLGGNARRLVRSFQG